MLKGFKQFISRGNAVDLAVGMVVGAAFTGVVNSLVEQFLDPLVAGLVGKPNFDSVLAFRIGLGDNASVVQPGAVLTALVNFLLVAFALYFFVVVPMNAWAARSASNDEPAEESPSPELSVLSEIRDILAKTDMQESK
ncbi:MAG: large conductance mechanosensitive channel protein MscL [Actinomycetaceae bacterium]|nr:large conductance mechanosensitive channel protein MscL [Actinomycetaceae bacterium]